jgi:hypothetical protein
MFGKMRLSFCLKILKLNFITLKHCMNFYDLRLWTWIFGAILNQTWIQILQDFQ